ncbi:hypothetical protein HD806DRAFT_549008 [Xylariaceae sp. AK1471]|nr:hypothetical protein HD806DRAFT_549008 [Xylariaceae sp. AK1471]
MSDLPLREEADETEQSETQQKTKEIKQREEELKKLKIALKLSKDAAFEALAHLNWLRAQDKTLANEWSTHIHPILEQRQEALSNYKRKIADPDDPAKEGPVLEKLETWFKLANEESLPEDMEKRNNFCHESLRFAEKSEEAALKAYTELKKFVMDFEDPLKYHKGNLV